MRYIVCLAAAIALALPALASALPSLKANPADKMLARGIDPIHYDPATKCNGGHVWPGTMAMVHWLETNASGVNWGEYRCEKWGKGQASLHSEGRAIDWHPSSKTAAYDLIALLLAPDQDGNVAALARRMGVQGLIFNCEQWFGSGDGQLDKYSYCYGTNGKRKKNIDPTQAHMDHVHIELNKLGAAMTTTFWNKNVKYPVQTQDPVRQQPAQEQPQQPAQQSPNTFDNSGGSTYGLDHQPHDWAGGAGGGTAYQ
jgi:hypothetical protein